MGFYRIVKDGSGVQNGTNGRWTSAFGDMFPPSAAEPAGHGQTFERTDLKQIYAWDAPSATWVLIAPSGGAGTLTVQEADGVPTVVSVDTILFDQADGLVVTDLGAGDIRIDLSGIPQALVASLVADLAAKVPTSRLINTTAPIGGGGDLSADRTITVSAATTAAVGVVELATDGEVAANVVVQGNDARLSNARTPTAHAASHQNGGADEISVVGLSGLLADNQTPATHDILTKHNGFPGGGTTFLRDDGTFAAPPGGGGGDSLTVNGAALVDADLDDATPAPPAGEVNVKWQKDGGSPANVSASVQAATTAVKGVVELATDGESAASVVVQGNDTRMSNARTPTAHAASHQNAGGDEISVAGLSGLLADGQTPLAHAASHQNGGADEISVTGLSGLLADGQTPLAHKTSHQSGGADAIKLDDLSAPDDNTDLDASLTAHGLMMKYPGGTSNFLRADGAFAAPTAAPADPDYAPGSYTISTGKFRVAAKRQQFTSTQRLTLQGTARLSLVN